MVPKHKVFPIRYQKRNAWWTRCSSVIFAVSSSINTPYFLPISSISIVAMCIVLELQVVGYKNKPVAKDSDAATNANIQRLCAWP